jgi:RHS repeat-associated protein
VFNRFRLDLSTSGSTLTIKVYYNGAYKFTATDGSPFAAGSVGMIGGYNLVYWDNVVAMTNVSPATVVSYDDYDAWGMILEGRSAVNGDGRPRFKFTGKERDAESKYDYFGARYYDARIGRFLAADPLYFHASMLGDPQKLNPYSYVRNSPLVMIDPSGAAAELTGDEDKRKEQLEAARKMVGEGAGKYLYENKVVSTDSKGNETTRYFIGMYTNGPDGKGPAFESLNDVAKALGGIIADKRVVTLGTGALGTPFTDGSPKVLGPVGENSVPGITYPGVDGNYHILLLDSKTAPGTLPAGYMTDRKPGVVNSGIILGHELGHVESNWGGGSESVSNARALDLENKVRQIQRPNSAIRIFH